MKSSKLDARKRGKRSLVSPSVLLVSGFYRRLRTRITSSKITRKSQKRPRIGGNGRPNGYSGGGAVGVGSRVAMTGTVALRFGVGLPVTTVPAGTSPRAL